MSRKLPSKEVYRDLALLADSVGEFIQYWGFRKVHGQVWTLIYLAPAPINATEIQRVLKVSKPLISLAVQELKDYNLIIQVSEPSRRTKEYIANPDTMTVVREILKTREMALLEDVKARLDKILGSPLARALVEEERLSSMVQMTDNAREFLELIISLSSLETRPSL